MTPCTEPKFIGDTRYVYGVECTWHGQIGQTDERIVLPWTSAVGKTEMACTVSAVKPCCPHCAGPLAELPSESEFEHLVLVGEAVRPGYKALMQWAAGRCFPADGDLLEEAYRQAMEGEN